MEAYFTMKIAPCATLVVIGCGTCQERAKEDWPHNTSFMKEETQKVTETETVRCECYLVTDVKGCCTHKVCKYKANWQGGISSNSWTVNNSLKYRQESAWR